MNCKKLTDNCVVDGISKCTTLEKISIRSCENLTKECLELFMNCEVDFCYGADKDQNSKIKVLGGYVHYEVSSDLDENLLDSDDKFVSSDDYDDYNDDEEDND